MVQIKNLTKEVVATLIGKPVVLVKRNGALCRAELGGDGRIGIVNYGVKGQYRQSGLDSYDNGMLSLKVNTNGKGGSFDIVEVLIANTDVDAGDLDTAILGGTKNNGTIVEGGLASTRKVTTSIWKRVDKKVVTKAQVANLLGIDFANLVIID